MFVYDLHAYIKNLVNKGVDEEIAEIHAAELRKIIESDLATKKDIAEAKTDIIKWVVGFIIANTAITLSFVTGLFTYFQ